MNPNHILDNLSSHLKNTIARAIALATSVGHSHVSVPHLLFSLLEQQGSVGNDILQKMGIDKSHIEGYITHIDKSTARAQQSANNTTILPELDKKARSALEKAMVLAYEQRHSYVGTEHLLYGIMSIQDTAVTAILKKADTKRKDILDQVHVSIHSTSKFPDMEDVQDFIDEIQDIPTEDPAQTLAHSKNGKQRNQKALDLFAVKLTDKKIQKDIDPVIGREKEIDRLVHILSRRTKNNPVLVGEPGVGKTAIVEGLAKRIMEGTVPDNLKRKSIYSLDLAMLISGTIYRGEFEARIKQLVDEVSAIPDAILFIDELHNIIGAGSNQGTMDAANMLKPALARGKLRCIGATTLDEYHKYISNDPALERRFQSISVKEPSRNETIEVLSGIRKYYEQYHSVRIPLSLIPMIVDSSIHYIHDNFLPDKAIDILDEAAARVRMRQPMDEQTKKRYELSDAIDQVRQDKEEAILKEKFDKAKALKKKETQLQKQLQTLIKKKQSKRQSDPLVSEQDVAQTLSARLGLDPKEFLRDKWEQLDTLGKRLEKEIFGQSTAIQEIVRALKHARLHGKKQRGAYSSLLFVGPSGVGKTALAKSLAKHLYQDPEAFIRFDMSEFAEGHSVSKLLGSPAGYVGHKERNRFTEQLKKRPHSVVLFDEIDKAHPDVVKLLLQILDEGELSDSAGKKISFHNAIIVMTSNIGEEFYRSAGIGFERQEQQSKNRKTSIEKKLQESFSRAFMGRIQSVSLFEPLTTEAIEHIISGHIDDLNNSLKEEGVEISYTKQILAQLAKKAYNGDSGARFVAPTISRLLDDELIRILKLKKRKKHYKLVQGKGEFFLE